MTVQPAGAVTAGFRSVVRDATRTSPAAAAGRVSVTVGVAVVEELVEVPTAVTEPELPPVVTVIVALAEVDPALLAAVNFAA
jgi:hypothetical protein